MANGEGRNKAKDLNKRVFRKLEEMSAASIDHALPNVISSCRFMNT